MASSGTLLRILGDTDSPIFVHRVVATDTFLSKAASIGPRKVPGGATGDAYIPVTVGCEWPPGQVRFSIMNMKASLTYDGLAIAANNVFKVVEAGGAIVEIVFRWPERCPFDTTASPTTSGIVPLNNPPELKQILQKIGETKQGLVELRAISVAEATSKCSICGIPLEVNQVTLDDLRHSARGARLPCTKCLNEYYEPHSVIVMAQGSMSTGNED
ncbi:hypothetical protein MMC28_010014 [Mycoblastus sanguinarius]|nr:hypothetical protein [Mycoblastus sanguinarius]